MCHIISTPRFDDLAPILREWLRESRPICDAIDKCVVGDAISPRGIAPPPRTRCVRARAIYSTRRIHCENNCMLVVVACGLVWDARALSHRRVVPGGGRSQVLRHARRAQVPGAARVSRRHTRHDAARREEDARAQCAPARARHERNKEERPQSGGARAGVAAARRRAADRVALRLCVAREVERGRCSRDGAGETA